MSKLRHYAWMILGGSILSLTPFFTHELHVGNLAVTRSEALASGALYLLGALGVLLGAGIILSMKSNKVGTLVCRWWAAIYGTVMVPFSYVQFDMRSPLAVVVIVVFALAWYYGAGKIIGRANT
jgi:hypothetical protein